MGGRIFKAFASIFTGGKKKPKKVTDKAPAQKAANQAQQQRQRTLGAGYGGQTIMSGTSGVTEQAQTGKTVLGG